MNTHEFQHIRLSMIGDVVLVEVLSRDLQGPELARELQSELGTLVGQDWAKKMALDFGLTRYLSSTGFGALVDFINKAHKAGKEVKLCNFDPAVRLGADIIGMGKFVEILDTRNEAVKAFEAV